MLILASKSPRREELLKTIINDFIIHPSTFDESKIKQDPLFLAEYLSRAKALDVIRYFPNDIVLGSDTTVIYKKKIFGKPKDKVEAFDMLKALSNKAHYVITGYAFAFNDIVISGKVKTKVYFNKLSDELILSYIETGSPMDKAGAYGIQDEEYKLVKKIKGSYSNVVGLPLEKLTKEINKIKKKYPYLSCCRKTTSSK